MKKELLIGVGSLILAACGQFVPSNMVQTNSGGSNGNSTEPAGSGPEAPGMPEAKSAAAGSEEASPVPAATTVSVSIKSNCKETVKVFFGEKPKFGSGRYSTVSSNSRSNHTFKPGEMFWIVDDGQNGLSSVTVNDGIKEIEITDGCADLKSH